jgi:CHORD
MKVFLHYEDNEASDLHKSLKITLPKSWKAGPTHKLIETFVETYNKSFENNQLVPQDLHLCIRQAVNDDKTEMVKLASDAVVIDAIPDRADVYIMHGTAQTVAEIEAERLAEKKRREDDLKNTVQCTHFGCKKRFPRGGPYPDCCYHKSPPVFHETAKFWSCCPQKKAYDFEDFEKIPGCQNGVCSEVKDDGKLFLGGTDLREKAGEAVKLKSIDDFNKAQAAGGSEAAPVLERLKAVMSDLGVEQELFDQVVEGLKKEQSLGDASDKEVLEAVKEELGKKLKAAFKSIAAEQLRIKS